MLRKGSPIMGNCGCGVRARIFFRSQLLAQFLVSKVKSWATGAGHGHVCMGATHTLLGQVSMSLGEVCGVL